MDEPVRVSVCIATRDRAPLLERLLATLEERIAAAGVPCEVIVADNGSKQPPVPRGSRHRHLVLEQPGKSRALNLAIEAARGELIAFLDDDEVPSETWLGAMLAFLRDRTEYAAVVGPLLPLPGTDPELLAQASRWRTLTLYDKGPEVRDLRTLLGANMMLRREVFATVGNFNEALGPGAAGCYEDGELAERLLAAGMRIGYAPDAVVYHEVDPGRFSMEYLRSYRLRSARSRYAADPRGAFRKAVRRLLADLPLYPLRVLLRSPGRHRTRGRILESLELLRLGWRDLFRRGRV